MVYNHIPGGSRINPTIANEHEPDIERQIRVVKKNRAVRHSIPFNKNPKIITVYIVFTVFMMLNYFQVKGGVYSIVSPNTTISGETLHCKRQLGLNIVQYCQVHENEVSHDGTKRAVIYILY